MTNERYVQFSIRDKSQTFYVFNDQLKNAQLFSMQITTGD